MSTNQCIDVSSFFFNYSQELLDNRARTNINDYHLDLQPDYPVLIRILPSGSPARLSSSDQDFTIWISGQTIQF